MKKSAAAALILMVLLFGGAYLTSPSSCACGVSGAGASGSVAVR